MYHEAHAHAVNVIECYMYFRYIYLLFLPLRDASVCTPLLSFSLRFARVEGWGDVRLTLVSPPFRSSAAGSLCSHPLAESASGIPSLPMSLLMTYEPAHTPAHEPGALRQCAIRILASPRSSELIS